MLIFESLRTLECHSSLIFRKLHDLRNQAPDNNALSYTSHYDSWINNLTAMLLGITVTWKEDIGTTPVVLVYIEPIPLPGGYPAHSSDTHRASKLVHNQRSHFQNLFPEPTSRQRKHSFIFRHINR